MLPQLKIVFCCIVVEHSRKRLAVDGLVAQPFGRFPGGCSLFKAFNLSSGIATGICDRTHGMDGITHTLREEGLM